MRVWHVVDRAASLALRRAGKIIAISMAMMAMTTNSSINVNAPAPPWRAAQPRDARVL